MSMSPRAWADRRGRHSTLLAQALDQDRQLTLKPPSEFIIEMQDVSDNPSTFLLGPYHGTMSNVGKKTNHFPDLVFVLQRRSFFFLSTVALAML